jgi:hypothetical protein
VVVACGGEHGWIGGTPRYSVATPLVSFELLYQLTGFLVPDEDMAICTYISMEILMFKDTVAYLHFQSQRSSH